MRQPDNTHPSPQKLPPFVLLALGLAVAALLGGCARIQDNVSFDMTAPAMFYKNQWARRGDPLVHVQAAEISDVSLTALFVPFRVTQPISNPEIIGYSEARTVWQTWLGMRIFSTMEFDAEAGPFRRDVALRRARAKGADLLVGGFVTYYYSGGSISDSQIALQIEIYDTRTGQLVWSVGHSALMPASTFNDYIVFTTKTRLPSDPIYALTRVIAEDIGALLGQWMPAPEAGTGVLHRKKPEEETAGTGDDRALEHPTF